MLAGRQACGLEMARPRLLGMARSVRRAERVINQSLERGCNATPFILGLLHQDVNHVQFRIYTEISTATAVPLEFAY
jgi:hypothetical protein